MTRVNVLGVGVSAINLSQATGLILEAVRQNRRGYVAVTGVHGVSEAQSDPEFRRILNAAFLNTPDGMPMSWVGRLQGVARDGSGVWARFDAQCLRGNARRFGSAFLVWWRTGGGR